MAPSVPSSPASVPPTGSALGPRMDPAGACPCGSGRAYGDCCGRWHSGPQALQAPDAESLMRSRYSAYVLGLMTYLQATWHPSTRPATMEPLEPGLRWLGLEVRRASSPPGAATPDAQHATVEFVARSKWGGRAHRLHEVSRFVREGGRWLYVDGQIR